MSDFYTILQGFYAIIVYVTLYNDCIMSLVLGVQNVFAIILFIQLLLWNHLTYRREIFTA